jgi:uncharacterized protein
MYRGVSGLGLVGRRTPHAFNGPNATARCCQQQQQQQQQQQRFLGATTITKGQDLFEEDAMKTAIKAFGDTSFLVNNVLCRQSVILLPNSFLLWNVKKFEDLTVENLSVFSSLYPTIEVLFLGCGEHMPRRLPDDIVDHFKSKGIVIEASNSVNAASTFNVLNGEGRNVAAALMTLEPYPDLFPLDE